MNMNPMQLIQMISQSANPMQFMMGMFGQNPIFQQAMQMAQGKTTDQLKQTVQNVASQKGIDLDSVQRQFGIKLPQ
jgi:hypothetical protein